MTVILYSLRSATHIRLENVEQIEAGQHKINGHLSNVWFLLINGHSKVFQQKHYQIERIHK